MNWIRAALETRRAFIVFMFSILSLMALSTIPYVTFRDVEVLRQKNENLVEPARDILARFELATARQSNGEAARLLASLGPLAAQLGAEERELYLQLAQSASSNDVVTMASTLGMLQAELRDRSSRNRAGILDAQRRALAWTVALFTITLACMLWVARMVWQQRLFIEQMRWAQEQAERAARDEQALRAAAAAVAAPLTTKEVVRQIARGAIRATNADGACAARLEQNETMRVIAVAGNCGLSMDAMLDYTGSIIEDVVRSGAATFVRDQRFNGHSGNAVIVPMIEAEGPIGVLTLLYDDDLDESELQLLLARANTFGDLAAVALRKARLLEQSEGRRLQLEAVEESRERLLRGFSHDIKNPLSNADGFLQLLEMGLRGNMSAQQMESLRRARASLGTGLRLLRDLLDFALTSVGHIPLNITSTPIDDVLREAIEDHRGAAEAKRIQLELLRAGELPELQTDVERARQVLDNLLSNAVKYTAEGGRVSVCCKVADVDYENRPGHWIRIDVIDNGIGIPP